MQVCADGLAYVDPAVTVVVERWLCSIARYPHQS